MAISFYPVEQLTVDTCPRYLSADVVWFKIKPMGDAMQLHITGEHSLSGVNIDDGYSEDINLSPGLLNRSLAEFLDEIRQVDYLIESKY